jgi:hypothetical protein
LSATIRPLATPIPPETLKSFGDETAARLAESGARLIALLVTTSSANNYPSLPIREGENVLVLLADEASSAGVGNDAGHDVNLAGPAQRLRLAPAEGWLIE